MPWRFNFLFVKYVHRSTGLIDFFFLPWAITQQSTQSERVVILEVKGGAEKAHTRDRHTIKWCVTM